MDGYKKNTILITLSLFITLTLVQSFTIRAVETTNEKAKPSSPIVYRRFVRKRPLEHTKEQYDEEIMEVFYIRRKPPAHLLTDEDIDRLIICDFEPESKYCKEKSSTPRLNFDTTTKRFAVEKSTTSTTSSITWPEETDETTKFASWPWTPTTTPKSGPWSPTTTPENWPWTKTSTSASPSSTSTTSTSTTPTPPISTTTPSTVSSENDLPFLPNVPVSAEETTLNSIDYDAEEDNELEGSGERNDDEDYDDRGRQKEQNTSNNDIVGDINDDVEEGADF